MCETNECNNTVYAHLIIQSKIFLLLWPFGSPASDATFPFQNLYEASGLNSGGKDVSLEKVYDWIVLILIF